MTTAPTIRDVRFDADRRRRVGISEAVLADVKSSDQVAEAVRQAHDGGGQVLITRLTAEKFAAMPDGYRQALDFDAESRTAMTRGVQPPSAAAEVGILTGGTADLGVAREAARTLSFHGAASQEVADVGVAGLWRLMEHRALIEAMPVLIVCAGMEGALFSVVGGLARGVIIAVPTSNGYGVAEGGRVALEAALASCAPGLAVTNIDNGYGAACIALRILAGRDPNSDRVR